MDPTRPVPDRRRLAGALALVALLIADGAAWSAAFARGEVASAQLALYPEQLDGRDLVLTLVAVAEIGEGRYTVRDSRYAYVVHGDPDGLRVGDELYVAGRFRAEGREITERWRERAPDRFAKKVLGFAGIALTALTLPLWVRVGRGGLALRG